LTLYKSDIILSGIFNQSRNVENINIFLNKKLITGTQIKQKKISIKLPIMFYENLDKILVTYKFMGNSFEINLDKSIQKKIKEYFKPNIKYSLLNSTLTLENKIYKKGKTIGYVEKINTGSIVGWVVNEKSRNAEIKILTIMNDKPVSFLPRIVNRPDVSKALNIKEKTNFGYYLPLPLNSIKSDLKSLKIFAVMDSGYYDELKFEIK
jgi:hypothetical protein